MRTARAKSTCFTAKRGTDFSSAHAKRVLAATSDTTRRPEPPRIAGSDFVCMCFLQKMGKAQARATGVLPVRVDKQGGVNPPLQVLGLSSWSGRA